jgi:membrane protease YdiL (CAAX protease family)
MQAPAARTTTTPAEAVAVVTICFGLMIWQSVDAVFAGFPTHPFTDDGNLWLVNTEVVLAAAALLLLHARGFAVETLYPRPSIVGALEGTGLYLASWLAAVVAMAPFSANLIDQPIDTMVSEATVSLGMVVLLAVVNATFEEVFLLGFLVRGLRGFGLNLAVGASLLVRVLYHLYQGPLGAVSLLAFGLVVTLYFAARNKLWPPIFCHMLGDIVPFL